jgi:MoaA/NifB/PqqE/SkfB family radical SAM enzyme
MTQNDDVTAAAYVDKCLWLPGTENTQFSGWLICYGWGFVEGETAQVALGLENNQGQVLLKTNFVSTSLARHDVVCVYPKASPRCGFDLIIPFESPLDNDGHYVIIIRGGSSFLKVSIAQVDNASETETLCAKYGLDHQRSVKFRNLLLNEAERLSNSVHKRSNPISLYIDPAFGCNLDCPHCLSKMLRDQHFTRKSIKPDQVKDILARYGDSLIRVTLALWGEPLLNKRFAEIVALCKRYRIFCETSSNLSIELSDSAIDDIVSSGLDEMRLSIDGATQEIYSRYRVNGNLDLVLHNVERLVAAKRRIGANHPRLRWQYLIFPWNGHERETAARLAQKLGVDEFYSFPGDQWSRPPSIRMRDAADDEIPLYDQEKTTNNMARRLQNYGHAGCDFLDRTLAINSDGAIFPCCYIPAPKDALGMWSDQQPNPFNAPKLIQLREFARRLRYDAPSTGPSPCASCGDLAKGNVEDHLNFWTAFHLVTNSI